MLVATVPKMKTDGSWLVVEPHRLYKNNMNMKTPIPHINHCPTTVQPVSNHQVVTYMAERAEASAEVHLLKRV